MNNGYDLRQSSQRMIRRSKTKLIALVFRNQVIIRFPQVTLNWSRNVKFAKWPKQTVFKSSGNFQRAILTHLHILGCHRIQTRSNDQMQTSKTNKLKIKLLRLNAAIDKPMQTFGTFLGFPSGLNKNNKLTIHLHGNKIVNMVVTLL